MFFLFCLAFMASLFCAVDASAVQGQVYVGDGATNNPVVPPGGWLNNGLDGSCLACHNGNAAPPFDTAPDMTSYLKTGHRNAMRMVQSPPLQLTGTAGLAYTADQYSNPFDWITNTINVLGFCTNPAFSSLADCTAGGGVWISGIKTLYYIFGGWMDGAPGALYDGSYTQGTQKTAVSFGSCARCHTTGYTMDTTFRPFRAPEGFFPGITWTPSLTSGQIDFDPDGNGPATRGSWHVAFSTGQSMGLEGVQCERCHDASNHFTSSVTLTRGINATALCLQCHRQDHILPYTGGALGVNIVPTAFTDNGLIPANEPLYPLPAIEVGGPHGYEPLFYDYSIGMEFLNSAHAKFNGNFQQIADPTKYGSSFTETIYSCSIPLHVSQSTCESNGGTWSQSEVQGGCTTCHNVHQSAVEAVNAAAPFKKQCTDCHTGGGTAPQVTRMNHRPEPLEGTGPSSPCQICHMPRLSQGSSSATHLFRINTNESYSAFPTESQWNSGQKTANASPDGTFTGAVWNDLDMSCGQCHGAGGSAIHFTKTQLAAVAPIMHSTDVSGIDCTLCHTTLVQSGPGQNHHAGICSTCHDNGAPDGRALHDGTPPSTANSACLTCHTTINQGVNHHAGTCTTCHSEPGVNTYDTTNASCQACHTDKDIATKMAHPYNSSTPQNCIQCHTEPGGPVGTTGCLACHTTGVPSYSYTLHLAAPNVAPTGCSTNWPPVVNPAGSKTVTHQDASSDAGDASAFVYMNWGDGSPVEKRALGYSFSHTYTSYGTYAITKTVRDGAGASCEVAASVSVPDPGSGGSETLTIATTKQAGVCSRFPTLITTQAQCTAVGGVWTAPPPDFSYSYELRQGGLTKKTGTGSTATSTAVTGLTAGTYNVYLTYPSGHICTYTNGTAVPTGATTTATACR